MFFGASDGLPGGGGRLQGGGGDGKGGGVTTNEAFVVTDLFQWGGVCVEGGGGVLRGLK